MKITKDIVNRSDARRWGMAVVTAIKRAERDGVPIHECRDEARIATHYARKVAGL